VLKTWSGAFPLVLVLVLVFSAVFMHEDDDENDRRPGLFKQAPSGKRPGTKKGAAPLGAA